MDQDSKRPPHSRILKKNGNHERMLYVHLVACYQFTLMLHLLAPPSVLTRLGTDDCTFGHLQEGIRERVAPLDGIGVQYLVSQFDFAEVTGSGEAKGRNSLGQRPRRHGRMMVYPAHFPGTIQVLCT